MSITKGKIDGGQGGKLGHSNMTHWEYTAEIKDASRKLRRHKAKQDLAEGLMEYEGDTARGNGQELVDEFSQ